MSEVKRYTMVGPDWEAAPDATGKWVRASDYDAAQSELAALREELAADCVAHDAETDLLRQKLTAAEQRNADLVELLTDAYGAIDENDGWKQLCARILAVVQPTESGASE